MSRRNPSGVTLEDEMVLIDGERVSCKCSLESAAAADNLFVEIDEIKFEVRELPYQVFASMSALKISLVEFLDRTPMTKTFHALSTS